MMSYRYITLVCVHVSYILSTAKPQKKTFTILPPYLSKYYQMQ